MKSEIRIPEIRMTQSGQASQRTRWRLAHITVVIWDLRFQISDLRFGIWDFIRISGIRISDFGGTILRKYLPLPIDRLDIICYNEYNPPMYEPNRASAHPSAECQAGSGRTAEQEVFLGVLKTADALQAELAEALKPADLSPTQYNVLRILRGAGSGGLPCGQISERMLTHDPDMTRLLDRLEKRALIERSRDQADRRVVRTHVTGAGRDLLAGLDEAVLQLHQKQLGHLGSRNLKSLAELLRRARERTP